MLKAVIGKKLELVQQPLKANKRKQSTDEIIFIGTTEPTTNSKRMKITKVTKHNGKGRSKQSTKASNLPTLGEVKNHESPKIWDIFERFQKFTHRRVLKRTPSGLLDEEPAENAVQLEQSVENNKKTSKDDKFAAKNKATVTESPFDIDDESSIGGDRKRRCVDYEDEVVQSDGKPIALPVNAFKPKCLNFDDIVDS